MFFLKSSAFENGQEIPRKYTGEGENISPPLQWNNVPTGTKQLVLVCDDPDAPSDEPFVHWVIYGLSEKLTGLPEGIPNNGSIDQPVEATQGTNSFEKIGYGGPMPPVGHGWHRYHFRLYALDKDLGLRPGLKKAELIAVMKGHMLGSCELVGRYQRDKQAQKRAV